MAPVDGSMMWKVATAALFLIFLAHVATARALCKNSCDVHDDVISCHAIVNADMADCLRKHPNAYILDLSYIRLDMMTADSLAGLTQIKRVFLDGSHVKDVSADVFQLLPNLRIVSLRGMGPAVSNFVPALRHASHLTHVFLAKNYKECSCDWWRLMTTVVASDMRVVDMEETPHCSVEQIRHCNPLATTTMATTSMTTTAIPTNTTVTTTMPQPDIEMPTIEPPETTDSQLIIIQRPRIMATLSNKMANNPAVIALAYLCGLLALTVLVMIIILIVDHFRPGHNGQLKIFKRCFQPGDIHDDIDVEKRVCIRKVNFNPGVEVREIRNYGPTERVTSLAQDLEIGLTAQRQKTLHYSDDETDESEQSTESAVDDGQRTAEDFSDEQVSDPEDVTETLLDHGEVAEEEQVAEQVAEQVTEEDEQHDTVKPNKFSKFIKKWRKKPK